MHISTSPPYLAWIRDAVEHAEAIEEVLLAGYQLERGQRNGHLTHRRWKPRTPAMAAGLTDHIWTAEDLLTAVAPPINTSGVVNSDKSQTYHPP